jgi:hypothetical protein
MNVMAVRALEVAQQLRRINLLHLLSGHDFARPDDEPLATRFALHQPGK